MKVIDLKETKAQRNGKFTVRAITDDLSRAVDEDRVKSIAYVVLTKDDEILTAHNDMIPTQAVGLLESGKQIIIDDMFYQN